jgi:hypothetical protein
MWRRRSLEEPVHHQEDGRPASHGSLRDEGRSPPAHQGTHLVHALSPHATIGEEHRSITPTCPTMGVLTLRKVTIWHQLMVPSSSNDDSLPLGKHDTWVDLNSSGARIRYIQEPALVSDSPPPSPPPYIVSG